MSSEKVKKWRRVTKERIIASFGGRCGICLYDTCDAALELHHLDPNEKEFGLGGIRASPIAWANIIKELRKCVLLCCRCHREYHAGVLDIPVDINRFDESYADYKPVRPVVSTSKSRQKQDWQSERDRILELKDEQGLPFTAIAKIYNVSDHTISKWYRRFKGEPHDVV